jgi:hypothetical protein
LKKSGIGDTAGPFSFSGTCPMRLFFSSRLDGLSDRFTVLGGTGPNFDKVVTFGREEYVGCINAPKRCLRLIGAGAASLDQSPQSSLFGGGT